MLATFIASARPVGPLVGYQGDVAKGLYHDQSGDVDEIAISFHVATSVDRESRRLRLPARAVGQKRPPASPAFPV